MPLPTDSLESGSRSTGGLAGAGPQHRCDVSLRVCMLSVPVQRTSNGPTVGIVVARRLDRRITPIRRPIGKQHANSVTGDTLASIQRWANVEKFLGELGDEPGLGQNWASTRRSSGVHQRRNETRPRRNAAKQRGTDGLLRTHPITSGRAAWGASSEPSAEWPRYTDRIRPIRTSARNVKSLTPAKQSAASWTN